ncbi:MAG: hypothetical protein K2G86_09780, partial [Prevotella sp.]|nr:hypothetical protein [Prevotella sp.]
MHRLEVFPDSRDSKPTNSKDALKKSLSVELSSSHITGDFKKQQKDADKILKYMSKSYFSIIFAFETT